MNSEKYRKFLLQYNWGLNLFDRKIYDVDFTEQIDNTQLFTIDLQLSHPFVLSERGFWVNHNQLCIGYEMGENTEIFRPIFSQKRQNLIYKLNFEIIRRPYFFELCKLVKIPIDCVKIIVIFIL